MICLLPNCCFLSETSGMREIAGHARRLQAIFASVDGRAVAADVSLGAARGA